MLFCGINPSLYSAATGHHFARPGNRFWPVLHRSGFTARQLLPGDQSELLEAGLGVTNLVARATAAASELEPSELVAGARRLEEKACRFQPRWIALLGVGAYRLGFGGPASGVGEQDRTLCGARLWLLPNPSGLNAHYQLPDLVAAYSALRTIALR